MCERRTRGTAPLLLRNSTRTQLRQPIGLFLPLPLLPAAASATATTIAITRILAR